MEEILSYPVAIYYSEADNVFYADIYFDGEMNKCATFGQSFREAVDMTKDWIALAMQTPDSQKFALAIPDISAYQNISERPVIYLDIWMPYYLATTKQAYQRKNVTIPAWLAILAQQKNINFSQLLTSALKAELGIQESPHSSRIRAISGEI